MYMTLTKNNNDSLKYALEVLATLVAKGIPNLTQSSL